MPFGPVENPISAREAFARPEESAALSQAGALLMIGSQLRGDGRTWVERILRVGRSAEFVADDDRVRLGVPRLEPAPGAVNVQRVRENLSSRYRTAFTPGVLGRAPATPIPVNVVSDIAERFFQDSNPENATDLFEACLIHPSELVRVAAAIGHHGRSPELDRLIAIVEDGTRNVEELVRDLAATGLARMDPANPRLSELQSPKPGSAPGEPSHTSLLVHGTWARTQTWWQPGGDFHTYILQNVRKDLYAAADRFEWSGGYSDQARADAATDLLQWVGQHNLAGLNLMTHSHGGSVAMLASQNGLTVGELVLLSCPVHSEYQPNFANISGRAVSIRVHFDLVLLADRSGQRFNDPRIEENVLPIWFDHSATHNPDNWKKYDVPKLI